MQERSTWAAVVVALFSAGCPGCSGEKPAPPMLPERCFEDSDCPSAELFFCNTSTSTCDPACRKREDCAATVRGAFALTACEGPLGCDCDLGVCRPTVCTTDRACGDDVCRNGQCTPSRAVPEADGCELHAAARVVPAELPFDVAVLATSVGEPVVPAQVSWSATGGAALPDAGLSVRVTPSGPGLITVTARAGRAECSASVEALATAGVPAGALDAVVFDALTGEPIGGATVAVTLSTALGPVIATSGTTGAARLPTGGAAVLELSVFHPAYDYLTVVRPLGRVIALPLAPSPRDAGVASGGFTGMPSGTSDFHLAAVGSGVRHGLVDLSTQTLLGGPVTVESSTSPSVSLMGRALPSGVVFQTQKETFAASLSAERGTVWALTRPVYWGDVASTAASILMEADPRDHYESLLQRLDHRDVYSTVRRDVAAGPLTLEYQQSRLAFAGAVRVGELPKFSNSYPTGALALVGAHVPGRGWVPLGVGSGTNQNHGSRLDPLFIDGMTTEQGLLSWRAAPPHHGVEGWPLSVVVLTRSLRSQSATRGSATSGAVLMLPRDGLVSDPAARLPVDLPRLPPFPEDASFDRAARAFRLPARSIGSDTSLVQLVLEGPDGRWVAMAAPSSADAGFVLAAPPAGFADRAAGARVRVQTLRLQRDGGVLSFDEVVDWSSSNLAHAAELTSGFASMDYP